ncbi:putative lipid II flippase FtsW [Luminiphilus sp.]|jgi:cell division protein FtsW|nr:putative lipid II flippase FtsW [Luminiphilus sp.]MDA9836944.1 putative lipid II flippase FtsW [Luminiphilus sp.]MDA9950767.1 putative lipid II flippase FtsW [Luminiphilus sp.]MDB2433713.1 putative lipid II flippase FtsW [Luminiphilus sp.]MDB2556599.1 putative lipid II flippase FtsW [Luminiphilus sp.]
MTTTPRDNWAGSLLLVLASALIAVGVVAISSASISLSEVKFGNEWHHAIRHLSYLAIGVTLGFVAYLLPLNVWRQTSPWLLMLAFALLVLVLVPGVGRVVNGSQRWIPLAGFTLQPSEFAKFALVLWLSGYMVRHGEELRTVLRGLLKPILVLILFALLLLSEPDFGATVIILGTAFGMLFMGGARLIYVLGLVVSAVAIMAGMILMAPYRMQRLMAYQDPWSDPFGSGFQLIQSLIAYGRGEWLGVGLGNSVQKLFYLPEAHTDFVFSIWAEETGLVGAVAVIILFAVFVGRIVFMGYRFLLESREFEAYCCFGFALVFAGQAFVNMGVSSGLLPTKGLTLPFISYGGNSLMMSCVTVGLLLKLERSQIAATTKVQARRRLP